MSRTRGRKNHVPSEARSEEAPWNVPMSRRTFVKAGIAVGGVASTSVMVAGKSSLQALQVGQPAQQAAPADPFASQKVTLTVNGKPHTVNVEPRSMLVDVLRDQMGLIATKRPCNRMACGACTVLIDGKPIESCGYIALRAVGHSITTAEIATGDPVVSALEQAWVVADGGQCAYCGPGFIMAAAPLLKQNPNPTVNQIKQALNANLCRCGNYLHIIDAVQLAAKNLRGAS